MTNPGAPSALDFVDAPIEGAEAYLVVALKPNLCASPLRLGRVHSFGLPKGRGDNKFL
jgi:hypothetical protein